jgi:predicted solute-binding protein
MQNQEIRNILIKELGLEGLPEEAQDEVVAKVGEVILKSLTVAIFEKIPVSARAEFERISAGGDSERIQDFLDEHVPDLHTLMEEEVRKALQKFAETEAKGGEEKARGEE